MPWLEIGLISIAALVAFLTGLSSSPLYSSKQKESSEEDS
tara:strand:+ start:503 stop:622 length:120 start_codon:yes stop_codon:yes gene_type:complete